MVDEQGEGRDRIAPEHRKGNPKLRSRALVTIFQTCFLAMGVPLVQLNQRTGHPPLIRDRINLIPRRRGHKPPNLFASSLWKFPRQPLGQRDATEPRCTGDVKQFLSPSQAARKWCNELTRQDRHPIPAKE